MSQIVIVEDDGDIRNATLEFLEMEGYTAQGCVNGQDALSYLRSQGADLPNLLIVDLNMPIMNGPAFLAAQKADENLKKIPCVIMSANAENDAKDRKLPCNHYLRKPIDLDDLLAVVRRYVKH
jgi:CheY-like chemotaxis protein